ncbi:MAG: hypothetical protein FWH29_09355 [Methanobrevibacter sp.]|nr:hypothetical protein [Methanobrevibacter sp.]
MIEKIIQIIIVVLACINTVFMFRNYESKSLRILSIIVLILVIIGAVFIFFKY